MIAAQITEATKNTLRVSAMRRTIFVTHHLNSEGHTKESPSLPPVWSSAPDDGLDRRRVELACSAKKVKREPKAHRPRRSFEGHPSDTFTRMMPVPGGCLEGMNRRGHRQLRPEAAFLHASSRGDERGRRPARCCGGTPRARSSPGALCA